MNRFTLLSILLASTLGCDNEDKPTTEPTLRDAAVEENSTDIGDFDLDVEYYDFDTISIEPDLDLGPDMDD